MSKKSDSMILVYILPQITRKILFFGKLGGLQMEMLKEYSEKYGLKEVVNDYGEHRHTSDRSIVFPNGWVASIVENNGVDTYKPNGEHIKEFKSNKNYSVAMCDYNGYFDWDILNQFGAIDGCIYCDTELELLVACETIRRL